MTPQRLLHSRTCRYTASVMKAQGSSSRLAGLVKYKPEIAVVRGLICGVAISCVDLKDWPVIVRYCKTPRRPRFAFPFAASPIQNR